MSVREVKLSLENDSVSQPKKRAGKRKRPLVINTSLCRYTVVRDVAYALGYVEDACENPTSNFDLFWADTSVALNRVASLTQWQRINHFPAMHMIARKGHLAHTLARVRARVPRAVGFAPQTWALPADTVAFRAAFSRKKIGGFYIVKPAASCQGRDITVSRNPVATVESLLGTHDGAVVQKYVSKPLLLDSFKFDLRVYVLVTSITPLSCFVYHDGLVRLATTPYQPPRGANCATASMHLTNYAVNKDLEGFQAGDGDGGSKRDFAALATSLAQQGLCVGAVWAEVDAVIVKTLLAAMPTVQHTYLTGVGGRAAGGGGGGGGTGRTRRQQPSTGGVRGAEGRATAGEGVSSTVGVRDRSGGGERDVDAVEEDEDGRHVEGEEVPCSDASSDGSDSSDSFCDAEESHRGGQETMPPPLPPSDLPKGSLRPPSSSVCFEILGFDILFTSTGRAKLLEVNHAPSLQTDAPIDERIKTGVVRDSLLMLSQSASDAFRARRAATVAARSRLSQRAGKGGAQSGGAAAAAGGGDGGGGGGGDVEKGSGVVCGQRGEGVDDGGEDLVVFGLTPRMRYEDQLVATKQLGWRRVFPVPSAVEGGGGGGPYVVTMENHPFANAEGGGEGSTVPIAATTTEAVGGVQCGSSVLAAEVDGASSGSDSEVEDATGDVGACTVTAVAPSRSAPSPAAVAAALAAAIDSKSRASVYPYALAPCARAARIEAFRSVASAAAAAFAQMSRGRSVKPKVKLSSSGMGRGPSPAPRKRSATRPRGVSGPLGPTGVSGGRRSLSAAAVRAPSGDCAEVRRGGLGVGLEQPSTPLGDVPSGVTPHCSSSIRQSLTSPKGAVSQGRHELSVEQASPPAAPSLTSSAAPGNVGPPAGAGGVRLPALPSSVVGVPLRHPRTVPHGAQVHMEARVAPLPRSGGGGDVHKLVHVGRDSVVTYGARRQSEPHLRSRSERYGGASFSCDGVRACAAHFGVQAVSLTRAGVLGHPAETRPRPNAFLGLGLR